MANLKVAEGVDSQEYGDNILPMVGMILPYAGTTSPSGWLICNGSQFSKIIYPKLFETLGSNTLPDLRGRYLVGKNDSNVGLSVPESHAHNWSFASFTSSVSTTNHGHTINAVNYDSQSYSHTHAANLAPSIDGFGNNAGNKVGNAQGNLTNQNHAHSTGGYYLAAINADGTNHTHGGTVTRNDVNTVNHSHTINASTTGSSFTATGTLVPTIYFNFIIKAG